MKLKKIFLILVPILTILYCLDSLLLDIRFEYEVFPVYSELDSAPQPNLQVENFHIKYGNGLIQYVYKIQKVLTEMNDSDLPQEGTLEKTKERLEKILIGREISLSIYLFTILLAISSFFSLIYNAWFSIFLSRFLYIFSIFIAIINLVRTALHFNFIPNYAFFSGFFHLTYLGISIYCFFIVKKYLLSQEISYPSLYIASQNSEETGSGKVSFPYEKKSESQNSTIEKIKNSLHVLFSSKFRVLYHFLLIIFMGFLLGNLVYIPLFSLQKHYSKEFGYLLGFSLILLSLFYIRNYYVIGKENQNSFLANLSVSASFLMYRFLRNLFIFVVVVFGITIFVVAFLFLLNYNISILIDNHLIERNVSL